MSRPTWGRGHRSRESRSESGQSTVEFVIVLPVIFVVLLGLVQVGVVVQAQVGVTHTAREVARVLAVQPTADPYAAAEAAGTLDIERLEVIVTFEPHPAAQRPLVVVQVRYEVPPVASVIEVAGDIVVTAHAAMMVES